MSFNISIANEFSVVAAGTEATTLAMASIKAPDLPEDENSRAPMELVAVVDRSGSMQGQKMKLMKETLQFVVTKGLSACDSFALVAYDNQVQTRLTWTTMDSAGKKEALDVIRQLSTGGATNLSGGLLQGIDLLSRCTNQNSTKAVMLFTDGLANHGIRDGEGIVNAMSGALQGVAACSTFTFGFGADHSEDMLRGIADAGQGLYYFVENADTIPQAFADCLGGLVSVVGQNATLSLTAQDGVKLPKIMGTYKSELNDAHTEAVIQLGDMYAEDAKDVLLEVAWPALQEPGTSCVQLAFKCFNVITSRMETQTVTLELERPREVNAQTVNPLLDVQRNRMRTAEAQAQAARLADAGDLEQGTAVLKAAMTQIQESSTAAEGLCQTLVQDLQRCEEGFADRERYRSYGSKMAKMSYSANMQQRCTHNCGGAYENKSKRSMKSAFMVKKDTDCVEDEDTILAITAPARMASPKSLPKPQRASRPPQKSAFFKMPSFSKKTVI